MSITAADITNIIGSPIANTTKYWPLILAELDRVKRNKLSFQVALLATIGVESGSFKPINEMGSVDYFTKNYDITGKKPKLARSLGNVNPGDGAKYHGRGFVQLTGRHNYTAYGKALGIDLVNKPELANGDKESVAILVKYCVDHGIDVWAERAFRTDDDAIYPEEMCTRKIRQLVNGGYNHYDKFKGFYDKFKAKAVKNG